MLNHNLSYFDKSLPMFVFDTRAYPTYRPSTLQADARFGDILPKKSVHYRVFLFTGLTLLTSLSVSLPTYAEPPLGALPKVGALSPMFVDKSVPQAITQPSLFAVIMAEFAADRGQLDQALTIYKQQSRFDNTAPVFERALALSLAHEPAQNSLEFASLWQQNNPEHVPALFYVTHLALKAHNYEMAGEKLAQILAYDPDADLSQILLGIYPTQSADQAELLNTLQAIDSKNNPSLLVMKAGLLLQFNQPNAGLVEINKALKKQPKSPAFLILKADILQALAQSGAKIDVARFINQARKLAPNNKSLFLYQARYLLQNGKSKEAWQQLTAKKNSDFLKDEEIKLLAGLVGIDIGRYVQADNLLLELTHSPNYKDQAYYYLAINAERQMRIGEAIYYYGNVMQPSLVLTARKKQVALLQSQNRIAEAIASVVKLRTDFDEFIVPSYIMQANILSQNKQPDQALAVLNLAQRQLPDNTDIMFAKVLLLPDDDYQAKLPLLKDLVALAPNNVDYQLEYAQTLVNLKQDSDTVNALLLPLINDREIGLNARQILSQQAIHQNDNAQVISLLSDNFDIVPDVVSGLLLRQAYRNLGNNQEAQRIDRILQTELDYQAPMADDKVTNPSTTNSTLSPTAQTPF